ncbi:MAG: lasso peptide biosynthesis B2 protein [Terriglobales bacterium]
MSRLRKFLALPGSERKLLMKAVGREAWISAGLRLLPFSYWRPRMKESDRSLASRKPVHAVPAERVAWAVSAAARYVPGATCLVQALVARDLLRSEGYPARICLGVDNRGDDSFRAHAWVECEGRVLLGGNETGYAPLPAVGTR